MENLSLSTEDVKMTYVINNFLRISSSIFWNERRNDTEYRKLVGTIKYEGENKGQFGYYPSPSVGELCILLSKLGVKEIVDLGSGIGLLLLAIKAYNSNIKITGFENEKYFIDIANQIGANTYKKDILTLKKYDIRKFDALFFYEPFSDPTLSEAFVKNLLKRVSKGQFLIYERAGTIGEFLDKSNKVKRLTLEYAPIILYEVQ